MPWIPEEEIKRAREITAIEYLKKYQPNRLKKSSARNEWELTDHDSFKINEQTSQWHWKSRDIGGTSALNFLIHVDGCSFLEAVQMLKDEYPTYIPPPVEAKPKKPFVLPTASPDCRRVFRYLKERGISGEVLQRCVHLGILYESLPYHNAVFIGRDENQVARYAFLRGIYDASGKSFKMEQAGSEKAYAFCVPAKSGCRRVAVYEACVDVLAHMTLEQRSRFVKKLGSAIEQLSDGKLVNSPGDYEVELRLIANREGKFFPALRFYTLPDHRFAYRKHAIAASMHPSLAALIMELAAPYLKENAQIIDPFCGVGTILIERDIRVPAREKYGTDIFGEAIDGARENAALAGEQINFIHRDFFDFRHDYLFDEIVTNMPVRGKMTREQLDRLYEKFFRKALTILEKEAVIVMYTGEIGFVKKQLRLHREFSLLEEYCMQSKTGCYLFIIGVKR